MSPKDGIRLFVLVCLMSLAAIVGGGTARSASTATLCVGGPECFSTVQAAVDAAHDGDTIAVGAGEFAGGISIDKSISLAGAGAEKTTIHGGGPVLTLGAYQAESEPTVTITGVTVTGGVSTSSPSRDNPVVKASGGGIEIPPSIGTAAGATVSISNSVVTGNRAAPSAAAPLGPPCPGRPCPYAGAFGGGIDNWGALTLDGVTVSDNVAAGSLTSDAVGGGIWSGGAGRPILSNTDVIGNSATAVAPNGRFAEGGGIFVESGRLTIRSSAVNNNIASLTNTLPAMAGGKLIEMNANSGGIHVGDGVPTTIDRTTLDRNAVTATDRRGEPVAFDAAMLVGDGRLVMTHSIVNQNHVTGISATSAHVGPGGSALELDGGGRSTTPASPATPPRPPARPASPPSTEVLPCSTSTATRNRLSCVTR